MVASRAFYGPALALVVSLATPAAHAQSDPCDRALRKIIDDIPTGHPASRLNSGFTRLAQLEERFGRPAIESVDRVLQATQRVDTPTVLEEFLAYRSPEGAEAIFRIASALPDEAARRGVTKATRLSVDISPGERVHELLNAPEGERFKARHRESFLIAVDRLIPDEGPALAGTDSLFNRATKAAARNDDIGGLYEAHASAELQRTGLLGRVEHVDYDRGGAGGPNDEELIDTLSNTHAVQFKATTVHSELPLGPGGITEADLLQLKDEAVALSPARVPAVVSNVPLSATLRARCDQLGIAYLDDPVLF